MPLKDQASLNWVEPSTIAENSGFITTIVGFSTGALIGFTPSSNVLS